VGVTLENAVEYLKAGSFALGFVNSLFDPSDILNHRFDVIEKRAVSMVPTQLKSCQWTDERSPVEMDGQ
jgi:2-keto-3-deoxy-6-phosphogluconate aldolase